MKLEILESFVKTRSNEIRGSRELVKSAHISQLAHQASTYLWFLYLDETKSTLDFYSAVDGMLIHCRVAETPALKSLVPICTSGCREALCE